MKLQTTTSLTPDTVTRVSTGEAKAPRRRRARPRHLTFAEITRRVPRVALTAALKAAQGDKSRLWLDPDDNSVWVLNHPRSEQCPSVACPACSATQGKDG